MKIYLIIYAISIYLSKLLFVEVATIEDVLTNLDTPMVIGVLGWGIKKQFDVNEDLRKDLTKLTETALNIISKLKVEDNEKE